MAFADENGRPLPVPPGAVSTPSPIPTEDPNAQTTTTTTTNGTDPNQPMPLVDRLNALVNILNPSAQAQSNLVPGAALGNRPTAGSQANTIPTETMPVAEGPPLQTTTTTTTGSGATSGGGGSLPDVTGNPSGTTNQQNQQQAQQMAAKMGWTGSQWTALNNVAMHESGWNANAANPHSNARGIAQKISGWDNNYQQGNPQQQTQWMLNYIQQRYGTPEQAWAFWQQHNWY